MHLRLSHRLASVAAMTTLLMSLAVILLQALVAGINLALPQLAASSLHPSHTELIWIVDAYVLTFAALLIPAGALGDRIGRRTAVLSGLALFAAGCVVCALAVDPAMLEAGRALGGLAAALTQPATLSICLALAPAARRAHTVAIWTASIAIGGVVGNIAAGALLDVASWRIFFAAFAVPALILLVLVAVRVPEVPRHRADTDPAGAVLLVAGLFAVLYGIIEGPGTGWLAPSVLGSFGAGIVLLAAFAWQGLRSSRPMLDPRVFRYPGVRAGAIGVGAGFFGLFALFFVNAQFLQDVKGYSALETGFAIAPVAVILALVSARGAALAARFGTRRTVVAGLTTIAAGLLLVSTATRGTPYPLYALYLAVMATGLGICAPSLTTAVLSGLPPERAGLGSGVNSAAREVGAALGIAVIGTVLNAHHAWHSAASLDSAMAAGYRVVATALVALTALVMLAWRGRTTETAAAHPQPEPDAAAPA
jgi:EmrB/QacA subfamily drug resistance transporter